MLLITQQEIINIAFLSREKISPSSIRAVKIDIAQEHFIRPRFGNSMFEAMVNGKYADFVDTYIKPALAHFVRYSVVDELAIQLSDNGVILYSATESQSTDNSDKSVKANATTGIKTMDTRDGSVTKIDTIKVEENQTTNQTIEKTSTSEVASGNGTENSMTETILSNPTTSNKNSTQNSLDSTIGQEDKTDNSTQIEIGAKTLSGDVVRFREATPIERRIITQRALLDAKILLAKAVRHVESNDSSFELYTPSNYCQSIFF